MYVFQAQVEVLFGGEHERVDTLGGKVKGQGSVSG